MKILQVVQKPQRRGAETFAFQLSEQLRESGHQVITAYLYPSGHSSGLPLQQGDVLLEGNEAHPLERWLGFHPGLMTRLRRLIAQYAPDVIQANGARTLKYTGLAAQFGPRRWKLVYRNIGDPAEWVRSPRQRVFYSFVMQGPDGIVGVSETTLQRLRNFYSLAIPLQHIPRAVRPESLVPQFDPAAIRTRAGLPAGAPVILYVGSLSGEKRVDRLIDALARLPGDLDNTRLWLVGDGPNRDQLRQLASQRAVESRVWFAGAQDDVASFMRAADLFALTSDTEGIPGVILEAGWLGRPAVATDVGGVAECVCDGVTGLLVPAGDATALGSALERLLRNQGERLAMGARARELVADRFLMPDIAAAYISFYEKLLAT